MVPFRSQMRFAAAKLVSENVDISLHVEQKHVSGRCRKSCPRGRKHQDFIVRRALSCLPGAAPEEDKMEPLGNPSGTQGVTDSAPLANSFPHKNG